MKKLLLSISMLLIASTLWAEGLMRTIPFLQNPVNDGITVTWVTRAPAFGYVEYGTDIDNLQRAVAIVDGQIIAGNTIHRIRLKNIEPGIKYYYRAVSTEMTLYEAYKKEFGETISTEIYEFTIPDKNDDFSVAVFNDLHKQNKTTEALVDATEDIEYNLAIFNGDCIDDPNSLDEVVSFLEHAARIVGKGSIPMVFIRGNHEIRGAYSIHLRNIIEYSTQDSYGSFNWGDLRFVILDCGEDKPDSHEVYYGLNDFEEFRKEQVNFLEKELESDDFKQASSKILIHHIPIYYPQNRQKEYNPCYDLWHPILKDAAFDIALNAHTHKYAQYEVGEASGNNFPIIVGGGPKIKNAGVVILSKQGNTLTAKYITAKGKIRSTTQI
ncbi:MAG: FN3 domain-containing metallophosphoesterase family protein [Rikenellaceae bacterium]